MVGDIVIHCKVCKERGQKRCSCKWVLNWERLDEILKGGEKMKSKTIWHECEWNDKKKRKHLLLQLVRPSIDPYLKRKPFFAIHLIMLPEYDTNVKIPPLPNLPHFKKWKRIINKTKIGVKS
jgi:hypothetical protein